MCSSTENRSYGNGLPQYISLWPTCDQKKGERNEMIYPNDTGRRRYLKIAAVLGGASTLGALPNLARAQNTSQQTDTPAIASPFPHAGLSSVLSQIIIYIKR